jgi:hypothetical protein
MASLSRRERRLILGAGAGAAVIGAWFFVVEPVVQRNHISQEIIPARQEVLARRLDLVGRKDVITAELGAVGGKIDTMAGRFFTATTPAGRLGAAKLLKKRPAVRTDIRQRILPPGPREILGSPSRSRSRRDPQLVELLSRLEAAPKLLSVQDLKLRVVNVSQPKELLATVTLSGFILTGRA